MPRSAPHPFPMSRVSRRSFLRASALALGAGLAARSATRAWAQPLGANGDLRVAVIGLNQKGKEHLSQLRKIPGVRVVALCDVDPALLARRAAELKDAGGDVATYTDARRLCEHPDLDAVTIASPNHWHALHTIWACQAGKDVYVEKPISHTIWEGRQMVAAAARYGRIVQAGTQFRSDTGLPAAIAHLQSGALGPIQHIHALWYKVRDPIGRRLPWYPADLDYDHYCGPAPVTPLERDRLHYDWHWMWATGNGDLANLGVHCVDIARRFAGHDAAAPTRVLSLGGRFVHADVAETPNTQLTVFAFDRIPIFFESRGLTAKPGVRYMDQHRGIRTGVVVQCEGGHYAGYGGGATYDRAGKQLQKFPGDGGAGHMANFVAAVRSRRAADLAGPIALGHASTATCHYGNLSYRAGATATATEAHAALADFPAAQEILAHLQTHLAAHQVDLAAQPLHLGRWLEPDGRDGIAALAGADEAALARSRFLLRDVQRPAYAVPELA